MGEISKRDTDKIEGENKKKINEAEKKYESLATIEENFIKMCKSIDRCATLIKESAKGGEIGNKIKYISDDNNENLRNALNAINEEKELIRNNINKIKKENS